MKRILFPIAFVLGLAAAALSGMQGAHSLATQHLNSLNLVQPDTQHLN